MLRRTLPALAGTALLAALAALWPVPAGAPRTGAAWNAQAAARFWTPERMADAMPAARSDLPPAAAPRAVPTAPGPPGAARTPAPYGMPGTSATTGSAAPAGTGPQVPVGVRFPGLPTVGVLFSMGDDLAAHRCTASVVHSPGRDLILTAAHCRPGTDAGFVPQYRSGAGADRQPYGIWAVERIFTDPRWKPGDDATSDLDVAFVSLRPGPRGQRIEDVTGANRLARTPGYRNRVTVVGYPRTASNPADQPVICTTRTERLPGHRQLRLLCDGFASGTSGGPWLLDYDARSRTGTVVGLIGGLDGGGPDDRTSYSPLFGDDVHALFRTAAAG